MGHGPETELEDMNNYTLEAGNFSRLSATGPSTITSGNAAIIGIGFYGTCTGGVQLFAGVTTSVSLTPMITFSATTSAVVAGLSPMFFRFPCVVSGTGLTVNVLGSTDPNIGIFWCPVGSV